MICINLYFLLPSSSLFEIGAQTETQACKRLRFPSHRSAKICDKNSPLSIKLNTLIHSIHLNKIPSN